jgi:hypothetical protein
MASHRALSVIVSPQRGQFKKDSPRAPLEARPWITTGLASAAGQQEVRGAWSDQTAADRG